MDPTNHFNPVQPSPIGGGTTGKTEKKPQERPSPEPSQEQKEMKTGGDSVMAQKAAVDAKHVQSQLETSVSVDKVKSALTNFANNGLKTDDHEELKKMLSITSKLLSEGKLDSTQKREIGNLLHKIVFTAASDDEHFTGRDAVNNSPLEDMRDPLTEQMVSLVPGKSYSGITTHVKLSKTDESILRSTKKVLDHKEETITLSDKKFICDSLHNVKNNILYATSKGEAGKKQTEEINSVMTALMSSVSPQEHVAYHPDLNAKNARSVLEPQYKQSGTAYILRPSSKEGFVTVSYMTPVKPNEVGHQVFQVVGDKLIHYNGETKLKEYESLDAFLKGICPGLSMDPVPKKLWG